MFPLFVLFGILHLNLKMVFFEYRPVVEEGYWEEPLDPTLSRTSSGQSYRFFNQHIYPRHLTTRSEKTFHQYAELPAELQLRVLQHCNPPTLFQLMHTTRDLRIESKKLFFSDQETWYRVKADLLLRNPLLPESNYEPSFLASVQQLFIYSPLLDSTSWRPDLAERTFVSDDERSKFIDAHIETNIKNFWCTVHRFCPRVKRVMFSKDGYSFPDKNVMTECFLKMVQLCPQGFDVYFYTTEPAEDAIGRRRKRVLWRLRTADGDIGPTLEHDSKGPGLLVVPPEKPHRGPVGDFLKGRTLWDRFCGQQSAAKCYRAAVIEQSHFKGQHKPFGCSAAACDAWFDQPEQYTTHWLASRHGECELPPGEAGALVASNTKRLQMLNEEVTEADGIFWNRWGEFPSEQYDMAKREVMHQLEHDILYAVDKPVDKHVIMEQIYQNGIERSM